MCHLDLNDSLRRSGHFIEAEALEPVEVRRYANSRVDALLKRGQPAFVELDRRAPDVTFRAY